MRDIEELRAGFLSSGAPDFLLWLRVQPEGDRGGGLVSSSTVVKVPVGGNKTQQPPQLAKLPSKMQLARNLYQAVKAAVKSGATQVSSAERKKRLSICKSNACGSFLKESSRCARCGCWTTFKTNLAAWHCPINKW